MKTVTIWMGQIRKLFCGALYRKRSGILIVPDQRYQFLDQHDVMAENSAAVGQLRPFTFHAELPCRWPVHPETRRMAYGSRPAITDLEVAA